MTEEPKRQDKDARKSGENTRWYKIAGYLKDNPTLALTLLYLYVAAVGMLYSAVLYGSFGINIFDYSEIADFLLAAFKNPIALLFTGFQVAIIFIGIYVADRILELLMWLRNWLGSEQERRKIPTLSPGLVGVMILVSAGVFLAFTSYAANEKAISIKNDEIPAVDVRYRSFSGSAGQVTKPNLTLIGATQNAVFFYDVDDKHTLVIPQTQIVSIEVPE